MNTEEGDGSFELELPGGTEVLRIEASAAGLQGVEAFDPPLGVPSESLVEVTLVVPEGPVLTGTVVDARTGAPIPEVEVSLCQGPNSLDWGQPLTTDHSGRFHLSELTPSLREGGGAAEVIFAHREYVRLRGVFPFEDPPVDRSDVVVRLDPGEKVRVQILDPQDGPTTDGWIESEAVLRTDGVGARACVAPGFLNPARRWRSRRPTQPVSEDGTFVLGPHATGARLRLRATQEGAWPSRFEEIVVGTQPDPVVLQLRHSILCEVQVEIPADPAAGRLGVAELSYISETGDRGLVDLRGSTTTRIRLPPHERVTIRVEANWREGDDWQIFAGEQAFTTDSQGMSACLPLTPISRDDVRLVGTSSARFDDVECRFRDEKTGEEVPVSSCWTSSSDPDGLHFAFQGYLPVRLVRNPLTVAPDLTVYVQRMPRW